MCENPDIFFVNKFSIEVQLNYTCNIRPEDTYRRKRKLGSKTTGQHLKRALHAFHRLYQASSFGGLFNIGSTKTLLFSGFDENAQINLILCKIVSSWLGLSIPRPRGHS